ncbi:hypothetical protein PAXRUDRAFT_146389 [Paxillus rubicundulus Ve08.2h10]|uniref:Uncharacterized protein n=1 Tax=Paxillus rubicundulus Ve08.2h10 TaxID=930991 RepID=A0A0D0E5S7_9AGAM|nr:hypothetical protein PAXRUDRAFT_146389 [Paxillus rubicundulus Ve08.2h10]
MISTNQVILICCPVFVTHTKLLQPIQAVDHPSFKKMIDIASQATNGVVIPTCKTTHAEIMSIFKKQMTRLRECLNVSASFLMHPITYGLHQSKAVTDEVNLTCDAWQASNADGYFMVTGHWIEEVNLGNWELQSTVLGFTRLNNVHHGR